MLERSHLAVIQAVEEHGSLTVAAEKLHLTQSALSHAVKKLESQLGVLVWEREGRQLHLTQAGEQLLALARRVLPQFEQTEALMKQYARGERGTLKIGMECHPCYQWLLKVVAPYLEQWPDVDVDVIQQFKFGGIGALFSHEVDMLVTPDPLYRKGLMYTPVFDYEQVLVVKEGHPLTRKSHARPADLADEILITYPVEKDRLDIFAEFLTPAHISPRQHKVIETTDIMLQMVAAGRGVAALPRWLVEEYRPRIKVRPVRLGSRGIRKQIFLGIRKTDTRVDYLAGFLDLAGKAATASIVTRQ